MLDPKGTPCAGCPFRRTALNGWLGESTPQEFLAAAREGDQPLPCHLEVNYNRDVEAQLASVHQCSGQAIFLMNTCKLPHNREIKRLPANHELVFSQPAQFLEHHGKLPDAKRIKSGPVTPMLGNFSLHDDGLGEADDEIDRIVESVARTEDDAADRRARPRRTGKRRRGNTSRD